MNNYVLKNGTEITESEMSKIHVHYKVECTTEYILDNYDNVDENEARILAKSAIEKMNDYHLSEEEAVQEVMEEKED